MSAQQVALSDEFIAQQRKRLETMRQQLLGAEEDTIADRRADEEQHGGEAEEFEDDAQGMTQEEVNQSLRNVNDQRISDIERALRKIAEGTYGLSDASGEPIPKARLEAVPEAILTVAEQESREAGK
ncbi:conjugal transfer protein TraR [Paraburkholderia ginsengiterrae]|uniref:Conjugal transfer protein TraR n=1 Tax=Paraburkholderia ginsengiterrae TaxID=1462993 RepID=A0A1A9N556_9BURK|nr:TraR/DksA family transcriptional regulator [Paraburkholderia ginsengiterrae]OAJ57374.1 conjugal transfer protein TraR [Paraburkholderia ginsengiterrae]OAJ58974.1 conjugal transfer protein TraR [Paraburkholderia ginsengiterrae]